MEKEVEITLPKPFHTASKQKCQVCFDECCSFLKCANCKQPYCCECARSIAKRTNTCPICRCSQSFEVEYLENGVSNVKVVEPIIVEK